jgi:hypothetical protein
VTVTRVIPEHPSGSAGRLGRHVRHDPRSRAYQVRPRAPLAKSVSWERQTPILDQGDLGSCTGNAACGVLGGPVITGVNWYEGFDNPDASGNVSISGSVRGGHEFEIVAVDVDAKRFRAPNSWGDRWGDGGYFQFSYADYERLLSEDGDATQFVPITAPSPTPTPTDFPWADVDPWLTAPHWWSKATRAAKAIKAWKATQTGA